MKPSCSAAGGTRAVEPKLHESDGAGDALIELESQLHPGSVDDDVDHIRHVRRRHAATQRRASLLGRQISSPGGWTSIPTRRVCPCRNGVVAPMEGPA
jgi:hypothetical protein